ncbi:TCR gamma alternate reading frame protein, partial [Arapaima gigas]
QLSRAKNEWKNIRKMTCRAQHACFNSVEKSISLTDLTSRKPTVRLLLSSDVKESGWITLICLGTGFDPQITWKPPVKSSGISATMQVAENSEWTTVTSERRIELDEWKKGDTFTCEVTDQPFEDKVQDSISICTGWYV